MAAVGARQKTPVFPANGPSSVLATASLRKQIPARAECYSCHEKHAAVDTTFVQFYPTLLEIAKKKGTLSPNYLKEEAANNAKDSGKTSE